ncbi:hypothetical protein [Streptomyces sp. NPDC048603]|uniref:hypothetical protein n=1 Tax=Streptomyces sp. NPDC048603 TaxID=3365577 RepID=UPI003722874C
MAGFRSLAVQVRDARNDRALRRHSLRRCLERFAPYGHRATWWHLCDRHGIGPEDRAADPQRLVAALEELEEARAVWLEYERHFAERRRREKHDGLRRPEWAWGGEAVARCADPGIRPKEPLGEVLRRLVKALESEPGTTCPVCGARELCWGQAQPEPPPQGAQPWDGPVCAGCGIVVPRPALADADTDTSTGTEAGTGMGTGTGTP